jgi:hypothetical protein
LRFKFLNYGGYWRNDIFAGVSLQAVSLKSTFDFFFTLMFSPAIGRRKKKNADWLFGKKEM